MFYKKNFDYFEPFKKEIFKAYRIHVSQTAATILEEIGGYHLTFRGMTELKVNGMIFLFIGPLIINLKEEKILLNLNNSLNTFSTDKCKNRLTKKLTFGTSLVETRTI